MNDAKGIARMAWAITLMTGLASAAVAAAPQEAVLSGADVWITSGETYTSFANQPIPAGFFCLDSPPFEDKIALTGLPIVTEPPGYLGDVDTIVHRLDKAVFDGNGAATTRIQFLALSLVSTESIDVGCAQPFDVAVSLDGEQPLTEMRILRGAKDGGTYVAPLALRVKLVFTPVGGIAEPLTLSHDIDLGPGTNSVWSPAQMMGTTASGEPVRVDGDGDGIAEAVFPGFSPNFVAGYAMTAGNVASSTSCQCGSCRSRTCHCTPWSQNPGPNTSGSGCSGDHLHCVTICVPCSGFQAAYFDEACEEMPVAM